MHELILFFYNLRQAFLGVTGSGGHKSWYSSGNTDTDTHTHTHTLALYQVLQQYCCMLTTKTLSVLLHLIPAI